MKHRRPAHPIRSAVLTGHGHAVHAVAFDPGGTVLAIAGRGRTVRPWDLRDAAHPTRPAVLAGHRDTIDALAHAPDGRNAGGAPRRPAVGAAGAERRADLLAFIRS